MYAQASDPTLRRKKSPDNRMRIIRSLSHWPQAAQGSVMALGNFDGMHKGHQAVIGRARALAHAQGRPLAVMTFEPHPRRFFRPDLPVLRIAPFSEKARLLRDAGVDYLFVARFNKAFSSLGAEAFMTQVLQHGLQVAHVVTGHNFAFGHRRDGDVLTLHHATKHGLFDYTQVDAVAGEETVYSSTTVRDALRDGRMEDAAAILGRAYGMHGVVIHGDQRGRSIGFPTANIRPAPLFLPRLGVYAVHFELEGKVYDAVANFGNRPTVDGHRCLLEVHALDGAFDAYGKPARVDFVKFIRPEQKFSGIDALKAQIAQDEMAARAIHHEQRTKVQAC